MDAVTRAKLPLDLPPPLPDPATTKAPRYDAGLSPPVGCYLIHYRPAVAAVIGYEGTLRLEAETGSLLASGDLYGRATIVNNDTSEEVFAPPADPAAGVPIFPLDRYRYYLLVTAIEGTADAFTLTFETRRYNPDVGVILIDGSLTRFPKESTLTARMARALAPPGFPKPDRYFEGDVTDETGTITGRFTMGWVSPFLRRASVEIDRLAAAKFPSDAEAGGTWTSILAGAGWDFSVILGDENVPETGGEFWSGADAHKAMDVHAQRTDLNKEWRYYILAVRRIKSIMAGQMLGERGYMFDKGVDDLDKHARQGLLIASDWPIPETPDWGRLQGKRLGETVAYFRTALHELGHALGLDHNTSDNGVMCTTDVIAARSVRDGVEFPGNIQWSFATDDAHRLRHWPDHLVRPGGIGWVPSASGPIRAILSNKLKLKAAPLAGQVPLGAPVRVELSLMNTTGLFLDGPMVLSLMAGTVHGHVIDASGTARPFASLVVNEDPHLFARIAPGKSLDGSMTLLRGRGGALFPAAGEYRVVVFAQWLFQGVGHFAVAATRVTVTDAIDAAHAEAARRVLSTPETLLVLALGGDHLADGIAAFGVALKNAVLRPHVAYVEAKRLATRSGARPPNLAAAAALIDNGTFMSAAEVTTAAQIVIDNFDNPDAPALVAKLKAWAAANPVSDEVKGMIENLPV